MEAQIKQTWFGIAQYIEFPRILSLSSINRDWNHKLTPFQYLPHAKYPDDFDCYHNFMPANNIQLKILTECCRLSNKQSREYWCFRLTSVKLNRLPDMGYDECYPRYQHSGPSVFGDPILQSLRLFYSLANIRKLQLIGENYFDGNPKYRNVEFITPGDDAPSQRGVYVVNGQQIEDLKLLDGRLLKPCTQLMELVFDYYYFDEYSMKSLQFDSIEIFQCNHYAGIDSLKLISQCMPRLRQLTLNHKLPNGFTIVEVGYLSRLIFIESIAISNIRGHCEYNSIQWRRLDLTPITVNCQRLNHLLLRLDSVSNEYFINLPNSAFGINCNCLLSIPRATIEISAGFLDQSEMEIFRAAHSDGTIKLTIFSDVPAYNTDEEYHEDEEFKPSPMDFVDGNSSEQD